jgi:hypothetical protein
MHTRALSLSLSLSLSHTYTHSLPLSYTCSLSLYIYIYIYIYIYMHRYTHKQHAKRECTFTLVFVCNMPARRAGALSVDGGHRTGGGRVGDFAPDDGRARADDIHADAHAG